jgi:hypothetical protein
MELEPAREANSSSASQASTRILCSPKSSLPNSLPLAPILSQTIPAHILPTDFVIKNDTKQHNVLNTPLS